MELVETKTQLAEERKAVRARKKERLSALDDLPFVGRVVNKDNYRRRGFWCVKAAPTGNHRTDCETGRQYALQLFEYCRKYGDSSFLNWITMDMVRAGRTSGIEIGFMSFFEQIVNLATAHMPDIILRDDRMTHELAEQILGKVKEA